MVNIEIINQTNSVIIDKIDFDKISLLISHEVNKINNNIGEIEIALTISNSEFIKKLNYQYRGKDNATNVLSILSCDINKIKNNQEFLHLGDIVICDEIIKKESQEQTKNLQDHFTHMLIHGILHLLGYEHEDKDDRQVMENIEINLLSMLDVNNPYN